MPVNNIQPTGDDQKWKREVERAIDDLRKTVAILKAQLNARGK